MNRLTERPEFELPSVKIRNPFFCNCTVIGVTVNADSTAVVFGGGDQSGADACEWI